MSVPGTYSSMLLSGGDRGIQFVGNGGFAKDWIESGSGTASITPSVASGTQTGDVVILQVSYAPNTQGLNPYFLPAPTGWTQVTAAGDGNYPHFNPRRMALFWRVYDGTVPTITRTGSTGSEAALTGVITTWRGVNTTTPLDATVQSNRDISNRSFSADSVTTVTPGAVVAIFASCGTNTSSGNRFGTISNTNASLTDKQKVFDLSSTAAAQGQMMYFCFANTPGASGKFTGTMAGDTSNRWAVFTVPLRPA